MSTLRCLAPHALTLKALDLSAAEQQAPGTLQAWVRRTGRTDLTLTHAARESCPANVKQGGDFGGREQVGLRLDGHRATPATVNVVDVVNDVNSDVSGIVAYVA